MYKFFKGAAKFLLGSFIGSFFLFGGVSMFKLGLTLIFFLTSLQTLQCTKNEANQAKCKFSHSRILGKDVKLFKIYGSSIEKQSGSSRRSTKASYRVLMSTSIGQIPFTDNYSLWDGAVDKNHLINDKINLFATNSGERYLNLRNDGRLSHFVSGLFALFFGIPFIFIGGYLIYSMLFWKNHSV